jgi:hypothetical protein
VEQEAVNVKPQRRMAMAHQRSKSIDLLLLYFTPEERWIDYAYSTEA